MAYEELKKGYDYGLSKIYEMVINNDPCYAYLMRCNHTVDQKLVMAHVYGHCDFFKNNAYFAHTNRKMMDEMANHGARIRRYVEKYGEDEVEAFVDRCMSIDDLIDVHSTAIRRREEVSRYDFKRRRRRKTIKLTRFKSKDYMDDYINPREVLKAEEEERRKKRQEQAARNFPEQPEKDVLLFLIEHAPLKPWQRDVLSIIRDEAYYFAPQGQTKIMNEGWASLLALDDHDPEGPAAVRSASTTPTTTPAPWRPRAAGSTLQAGHRAVPRHRAALEHRASSARSTTSATTGQTPQLGQATSAWDGKKSSRSAAFTTILPSSTRS